MLRKGLKRKKETSISKHTPVTTIIDRLMGHLTCTFSATNTYPKGFELKCWLDPTTDLHQIGLSIL